MERYTDEMNKIKNIMQRTDEMFREKNTDCNSQCNIVRYNSGVWVLKWIISGVLMEGITIDILCTPNETPKEVFTRLNRIFAYYRKYYA